MKSYLYKKYLMSQSLFSLNKNKYLYLQNKSVTIGYMVLCMIREFLENTVTILKSVEGNESYSLDMRQQVIVMYKASVLKVRKLHKVKFGARTFC